MRGKRDTAQLDSVIAAEEQEIAFADLMASLMAHPGWIALMERAQKHRDAIQADIRNPQFDEKKRHWRLGEAEGLEWMMKRARVSVGARETFVENAEKHRAQKEKGGSG